VKPMADRARQNIGGQDHQGHRVTRTEPHPHAPENCAKMYTMLHVPERYVNKGGWKELAVPALGASVIVGASVIDGSAKAPKGRQRVAWGVSPKRRGVNTIKAPKGRQGRPRRCSVAPSGLPSHR
jgi:hypothetical protein